jgi:hypothetical protein
MHHDGQLPCDRNDRSLARVFTAMFHEAQSPSANIRIASKTPQRMLGTLDQEAPQEVISRFRDRKLG